MHCKQKTLFLHAGVKSTSMHSCMTRIYQRYAALVVFVYELMRIRLMLIMSLVI